MQTAIGVPLAPQGMVARLGRHVWTSGGQGAELLEFIGQMAIAALRSLARRAAPPMAADPLRHSYGRLRRAADHGPARLPDGHRDRLPGGDAAPTLRSQPLRRGPRRSRHAARALALAHRDHHRRPFGLGLRRADRDDGGDEGGRCASYRGHSSDRAARAPEARGARHRIAAPHRPCRLARRRRRHHHAADDAEPTKRPAAKQNDLAHANGCLPSNMPARPPRASALPIRHGRLSARCPLPDRSRRS